MQDKVTRKVKELGRRKENEDGSVTTEGVRVAVIFRQSTVSEVVGFSIPDTTSVVLRSSASHREPLRCLAQRSWTLRLDHYCHVSSRDAGLSGPDLAQKYE